MTDLLTTAESDEDSVDADLSYGDRISYLEQVMLVNRYAETIEAVGDGTFRLKNRDGLDRSDLHTLRCAGTISDSGLSFGREVDWQFTDEALEIHRMLKFPGYEYLILDADAWMTLERNAHRLTPDEIELSSEREFTAAEYGWSSALLVPLHDACIIERVEQNVGEPDVWALTSDAVALFEWLFQD